MTTDYWEECISIALDEQEIELTSEQVKYLADALQGGFECYGMAYSTPSYRDIEDVEISRLKNKIKQLENEAQQNYDASVKLAKRVFNIHPNDRGVSVTKDGYVERF